MWRGKEGDRERNDSRMLPSLYTYKLNRDRDYGIQKFNECRWFFFFWGLMYCHGGKYIFVSIRYGIMCCYILYTYPGGLVAGSANTMLGTYVPMLFPV